MSEKPTDAVIEQRNLLSFVERKINSARNIPRCILRDILFVLGLRGKELKESIAVHEAGHALVWVLNELGIDSVKVHRMSHDTLAQIRKLLGIEHRYSSAGTTMRSSPSAFFRLWQAHPDKHAIGMIAGIAAEPSHVEILDALIDEGRQCEWNDIWIPCDYIKERFKELKGEEPSKEQVSALFRELIAAVKETFKDEKIAKALQIIKEEVLKHNLNKNVNAKILRKLEKEGYTQIDLDEMKAKIFAINIDAAITQYSDSTSSST